MQSKNTKTNLNQKSTARPSPVQLGGDSQATYTAYLIILEKQMPLTIVASINALPGKESLVEAELRKLIPITLAEAGCLQYDLHRDNETPCHFMFFEQWESRDLWQAHMGAPHLKAYVEATEGMIGEFTVHEMSKLE